MIGFGTSSAMISHSYVVGGTVFGSVGRVGGLAGNMIVAEIHYSYAANGKITGGAFAGGLVGSFLGTVDISTSYWDANTTKQSISAGTPGNRGEGKTTPELQDPTDFTGTDNIYADWGNFWCHPDSLEIRENRTAGGPGAPFVPVWDLGETDQYPVLNCHPVSVEEQQQQQ